MNWSQIAVLIAACGSMLSISTVHAQSFTEQNVSLGVDYRISFSGSPRAKPEVPTFGFNISMDRRNSLENSTPSIATNLSSNSFSKLLDIRFDSDSKAVRNMYVGNVNVLIPVKKMGVDGVSETTTTQLSWPLVAAGFASFYVWAEDRMKKPAPAANTCNVTLNDQMPSMGINCCPAFSGGEQGLYSCAF